MKNFSKFKFIMRHIVLIIFLGLSFMNVFSQVNIKVEKRDYQYIASIPKGSEYKHYWNEEFDLHLFEYNDSSCVFIIEGNPDNVLYGKYDITAISDSIYNYRALLFEDTKHYKLKNRTKKQSNVFKPGVSVFNFGGTENNSYWRLLMSENVSAGYIGVKEPEYFDIAIEGLKKKGMAHYILTSPK